MSDDAWLTEISPADIEAAMQRKAAREVLIAEQEAEITRLRAELATARREGMEMPSEFLQWMKDQMPSGTHIHNPEWWAKRIWEAAIRAAAGEVK